VAFLAAGGSLAPPAEAALAPVRDIVASVSLQELDEHNEITVERLRQALSVEGIVAVKGVPEIQQLRTKALPNAAACLPSSKRAIASKLEDGTQRYSIAQDVPLSTECPELDHDRRRLRDAVQRSAQAIISNLEAVCQTEGRLNGSDVFGHTYQGAGEFLDVSERLAHLNVFVPNEGSAASSNAMDLHTDAGLFVAFVPALFIDGDESSSSGFWYQAPGGDLVEPVFPNDGNVVVIMIGDSFENQINAFANVPLRPVPHLVRFPPGETRARAWFGEMYLSPKDKDKAVEIAQSRPTHEMVGCTNPKHALHDLAKTCSAGHLYCWMTCLPVPKEPCPGGVNPKCLNPQGKEWHQNDGHCTQCTLRCPDVPVDTNGFCNSLPTNMYMQGFVGAGNPDDACLVLLFQSWKLDSPLKFTAGTLFVFGYGVAVEALLLYRRRVDATCKKSKHQQVGLRAVLYLLQLTAAYLAMLFAMTYSVYIFASIILGLTTGHVLFNIHGPVAANPEPCCQVLEEEQYDESVIIQATLAPEPAVASSSSSCCRRSSRTDLGEPLLTSNSS